MSLWPMHQHSHCVPHIWGSPSKLIYTFNFKPYSHSSFEFRSHTAFYSFANPSPTIVSKKGTKMVSILRVKVRRSCAMLCPRRTFLTRLSDLNSIRVAARWVSECFNRKLPIVFYVRGLQNLLRHDEAHVDTAVVRKCIIC